MSVSRKLRIGTAVTAAIATMLVGPPVASAGPVEDLVNQVSDGVNQTLGGLLGGGNKPDRKPAPDTQGGGGSGYVPPAHGTNPHGQGTIAVLDDSLITPDPESNPFPYEPGGANETVVIGRSRGEQNEDGTYHGHVSILSLLGTELLAGADTDEGESEGGPVGDLNDALDDLCEDSGFALCLEILDVDSETDETGSSNSFNLASAGLFLGDGLSAFVEGGSSSGEISESDGCQTATGESTIGAVETSFLGLEAGNSESTSTACNDGTTEQENESSALVFNDLELLRILDPAVDCENGVPNTVLFDVGLAAAICNADDSSTVGGTQLDDPFGVREAFTFFLVDFLDLGGEGGSETLGLPITIPILFKTTLAAAESFAVAPPEEPPVCPDPANPDCPVEPPPPDDGDGDQDQDVEEELTSSTGEGPGAPRGPSARTSDDVLPFTGADVGFLALIGAVVMGTGLAGMALSDRRRRSRQEG